MAQNAPRNTGGLKSIKGLFSSLLFFLFSVFSFLSLPCSGLEGVSPKSVLKRKGNGRKKSNYKDETLQERDFESVQPNYLVRIEMRFTRSIAIQTGGPRDDASLVEYTRTQ